MTWETILFIDPVAVKDSVKVFDGDGCIVTFARSRNVQRYNVLRVRFIREHLRIFKLIDQSTTFAKFASISLHFA